MKDELRALRKNSMKPVSRMKKADIASELEKLRGKREEVPPVAATVSAAAPKKMEAKVKDVKRAKELEFPSAPVEEKKKGGKKESKKATVVGGSGALGVKTEMKKSKMERLMEMISSMSDSE